MAAPPWPEHAWTIRPDGWRRCVVCHSVWPRPDAEPDYPCKPYLARPLGVLP